MEGEQTGFSPQLSSFGLNPVLFVLPYILVSNHANGKVGQWVQWVLAQLHKVKGP